MRWRDESGLAATLAAVLVLLAGGVSALCWVTLGFQVVSTEGGRRLQLERSPVPVPAVVVLTPRPERLDDWLRRDGRVTLVSFFYSGCSTLCSATAGLMQQMQDTIRARGLERRIGLLSISFDPADTAPVLAGYARRQHADPAIWRLASVEQAAERRALLAAFGVVAIRMPAGDYQHNGAFHVVDRDGRLVRIMDLRAPEAALALAQRLSSPAAP